MHFLLSFLMALFAFINLSFAQSYSKDQIRITGSASVYPVIAYIYENSSLTVKRSFKKNPIIESVGTGAGFDAFCKQKFGPNSPDIVNASRPITPNEVKNCDENGIKALNKMTLGLDGIVLAYIPSKQNSKIDFKEINLTVNDLHNALSKYILKDGEVVLNTNKMWNEIREDLPKSQIIIYGPNSNSGTYDFFKEIIQKECLSNPKIVAFFKNQNKDAKAECGVLRYETYTQLPDQDSSIARKTELQLFSIGVLRFTFFQNSGKFTSVKIDGIEPTEASIISGKYKISRPLFVYYDEGSLAKVHGLKEFLTQVAKFSYRDIIKIQNNEYGSTVASGIATQPKYNSGASDIIIQKKNNIQECEMNKKIINFEFNCK